jgi:hypothetical protein
MGEEVVYEDGKQLQAGWVTTDQVPLAADTYYDGMLLNYQGTVAVTQTGTGNGTLSAVVAGEDVPPDVYTLTFTAALVADLTNAAGVVLAQGLTFADGAATTLTVGGLTFTVTDGSTAFVATDTLVATITAGAYQALVSGELGAIYNGGTRTLASAGFGDCIMGGEINETGLVSASNVALVLTEDERAAYSAKSFYIKRV